MTTATAITEIPLSVATRIGAYWTLGKPRIALLVLVSVLSGAFVTEVQQFPLGTIAIALLGIALTTYSASALNNVFDRDLDRLMERTRLRPLPLGVIDPASAVVAGALAGLLGVGLLFTFVNPLTGVLAVATLFIYLGLYTSLLKRRTSWANEIGGFAGAMPPVLGWAAVTGTLSFEPFCLYLVMLFWQPPHFWALATYYREDYGRASIPVLPCVASNERTYDRSLIYAALLVSTSIVPYLAGFVGSIYLVTMLTAGSLFIYKLARLRTGRDQGHYGVFLFSILYLVLFWAVYLFDHRGGTL